MRALGHDLVLCHVRTRGLDYHSSHGRHDLVRDHNRNDGPQHGAESGPQ